MRNTQIFISYASANRKVAEQVESRLKAAGFDVWRDQTRLETDWSREIAQALAGSDIICLIWTAEAAHSKWVKHEWLTASALGKPIIPCLFADAPDLPTRLYNTQGIKFDQLSEGLELLVNRFESITSFKQEYDYRILPSNVFIPYNPNPSFIGRYEDLLELYLKMIGNLNKIGLNQVGLVGLGGIGKTQLAVELVYRFSFAFEGGVYWIQGTDSEEWTERFITIARDHLHLQSLNTSALETTEQWLYALRRYCKENPQLLIVIDNVHDPDILHDESVFQGIKGLTPLTLGCDLLFTTHKRFQLPGTLLQTVRILSEEAAFDLLTKRRKPTTQEEKRYAKAICNAVGYLPLALVLIESYLNNYHSISFGDYYAELVNQGLDVIDQNEVSPAALATRHQTSATVTLNSQWQMLADNNAKRLFKLAGLFPEMSIIPQARLGLLSGIPSIAPGIKRPLEKAFNTLYNLSLIENSEGMHSIRLHPLVHKFARRLVERSGLKTFKAKAVNNLDQSYDDPTHLFTEYKDRGIDQVIADVHTAVEWCDESNQSQLQKLKSLELLLDRERHHLKINIEQEELGPISFLQQLHYRAYAMGLNNLANGYLAAKQEKGGTILRGVSVSEYEDPSLMRSFRGHLDDVGTISISPNGKRTLSTSFNGTLILWDVSTGNAIRSFKTKIDDDFPKACLDAEGNTALISTQDYKLILFDVNTGQTLRVFQSDLNEITALSMSPDGQYGLSAHKDGVVALWDMKTRRQLRVFKGYPNVQAMALCQNGWHAISQTTFNTHTLWRVETNEVISVFKDKVDWSLLGASLSTNGEKAISCSAFNNLTVWDTKTGEGIRNLRGHSSGVRTVSLSADAKLAMSAARETLLLWDIEQDEPSRPILRHTLRVDTLSLTKDGQWVLSGSGDKTLILWDAKSGKPISSFTGFPSMLVSMDSSANRVLSGSIISGELVLWDLESQSTLHRFNTQGSQLTDINLSEDGKTALAYTTGKRLILWDADAGRMLSNIHQGNWVWNVAFTTDNHYAAVSCYNESLDLWNALEVWDLKNGKIIHTFKFPSQSISGVKFLDQGQRLLVTFNSNKISILDVGTRRVISDFDGFGQLIHSRGISADGKYAITISNPDNQVLNRWDSNKEFIDRKFIDASLILWDLETGTALVQLLLPRPASSLGIVKDQIVFGDLAGILYFLKITD